MVIDRAWSTTVLKESVTRTVKGNVPVVVGVPPSINPVVAFIVKGGGNDPTGMIVHVSGLQPPVAATGWLYGVVFVPLGSVVVVICSVASGLIVIDNCLVADCWFGDVLSTTLNVGPPDGVVPAVVGVPEMTPEALSERPAGKATEPTGELQV